jgi:hypothetical protein
MPKFLAGRHYNEEEISRHLKEKNIRCWPVQMNGNKFATGQILKKPVEVVKECILAGWAQKSPEPCPPGTNKLAQHTRQYNPSIFDIITFTLRSDFGKNSDIIKGYRDNNEGVLH